MYSMRLFVGQGSGVVFEIEDVDGRKEKFRIVGLLANSIFQGSLLVSEANFKRLYPEISGYRLLLARGPRGTSPEQVVTALENALSEQGVDAALCEARLRDLLAVQNTYLSTFQSLGALGLLLGTFGLATVQLRSVLERRGELALMRSTGFARRRLAEMVMLENVVLLVGGLLTGVVSALLAVLPHWLAGGAQVPLAELAIYLGIVLVVGVISGLAAVLATLRAPLVGALRGG
jgi:ABC-type antimicrobial peptide transport system permease subunit